MHIYVKKEAMYPWGYMASSVVLAGCSAGKKEIPDTKSGIFVCTIRSLW